MHSLMERNRFQPAIALAFALAALAARADPVITPDPERRNASAVTPEVPPDEHHKQRELKLDYSTRSAGLRIVLPAPSEEEKGSSAKRGSTGPVAIGYHRSLPEPFKGDLSPRIAWTRLSDGSFVGLLSVTSPGAASVRIGIRSELAAAGEIRFFGERSHERFPPITGESFHVEGNAMETLWSPTVEGDTIGIEITVPSGETLALFSLTIDAIAHTDYAAKSFPRASKELACPGLHIDVACRSATIHRFVENAVGLIRFEDRGQSFVCSGTLMNDKVEDSTIPYFLTANHCVGSGGVARSVEAWWFKQQAYCLGTMLDSRSTRTTGGTALLTTAPSYDLSLLRFRERVPGGLTLAGWDANPIVYPAEVYGVHHPGGEAKSYSAGSTDGHDSYSYGVRDAIRATWSEGTTEGGSSGSGLFLRNGGYLVGGLSHGPACGREITDKYGPFRHFYPQAAPWLSSEDPPRPSSPPPVVLPLVKSASNLQLQSLIRVINRSSRSGPVTIHAIDDSGRRFGPVSLALDARESISLSSRNLEQGNPSRNMPNGVGDGEGDWRVELRADFEIEARAYIRTPDGFLTSMHLTAEESEVLPSDASGDVFSYYVPFFNPASNRSLVSVLRLANPGMLPATVRIEGVDAMGSPAPGGDVRLVLPDGAARSLSAQQLEEGGRDFAGRLGDGASKWLLHVFADRQLQVMSLMQTRSGHLSNLSL